MPDLATLAITVDNAELKAAHEELRAVGKTGGTVEQALKDNFATAAAGARQFQQAEAAALAEQQKQLAAIRAQAQAFQAQQSAAAAAAAGHVALLKAQADAYLAQQAAVKKAADEQARLAAVTKAYLGLQGQGAAEARALRDGVTDTGNAAKYTGIEFGRTENAIRNLGLSAIGIEGPLGKIVETMGALGIGGAVTTGILASVAVISVGYRKLTEDFEHLEEEAKKAAETLGGAQATALGDAYRQAGLLAGAMDRLTSATSSFWSINPVANWRAIRDYWKGFDADAASMVAFANALGQATTARNKALATRDIDAFSRQITDLKRIQGEYFSGGGIAQLRGIAAEIRAFAATANLTVGQKDAITGLLDSVRQTLEAQGKLGIATAQSTTGLSGALNTQVINSVREALERLRPVLERHLELLSDPGASLDQLDQLRNQVVRSLPSNQAGDQARRDLELIAKIDVARERVLAQMVKDNLANASAIGQVADNSEEAANFAERERIARGKVADHLRDAGDLFTASVNASVQLLGNLQAIDRQTQSLIGGLLDVVKVLIEAQAKALAAGVAMKLTTQDVVGLIGAGVGILSAIFGGGESATARRAREIAERNTRAIEKLNSTLSLQITGAGFAQARGGADALLAASAIPSNNIFGNVGQGGFQGARGTLDDRAVDAILRANGTTLQQLSDFAQTLGITLNTDTAATFTDSLEQLDEALKRSEMARFANTFGGAVDALNASFKVFGINDPTERLQQTIALLSDLGLKGFKGFNSAGQPVNNPDIPGLGAPAFERAFRGLNVTLAADRAKALANLQALFTQFRNGQLGTTDLGGLTTQEFLDQLTNTIDLLGQIEDAAKQRDDALQATIDQLRGFSDSLKLGALSPLSPVQQLAESRRQYQTILTAAQAGDQSAAAKLPEAARAFLEASRAVNASGPQYAADFARVVAETDALATMYAGQKSTADATLAATASVAANTGETVAQLKTLVDTYAAGQQALIDTIAELREEIAAGNRQVQKTIEGGLL